RQTAVGGPALAAAGVDLLHDLTENSVVGLVEVLRHYGYFKRLFAEIVEWIRAHRPRVLVLTDYPGFNLRLAEALKKEGLSRQGGGPVAIYYYISPQIWAWKQHRRFKMAETIDELGVIFPFEVDTFADTRLPVHFVVHPFMESAHEGTLEEDPHGALLLLAGSRLQPVERILPVMLAAAASWRERSPQAARVPLVTLAPNDSVAAEVNRIVAGSGLPVEVRRSGEIVTARAVLTSSGTMSLNCALAGIPGAIVYRAHPVTYWLGRRVVKIPYLGIANLILERPMYPEFIQGMARPRTLADQLEDCARPARRSLAHSDAAELRDRLSVPASASAPERIAALLE
ncbi:MAG: lipid-A-disaccharide synthase, partial [Verrucomicrobiota bacterium]